MNKDKQYIKPYKQFFLQAYLDYMYICNNYNKSYVLSRFINLCCAVQIGSGTNQYRVNLIKKFESNLLKRAITMLHSKIELTQQGWDDIHFVLSGKSREDLFYDILV